MQRTVFTSQSFKSVLGAVNRNGSVTACREPIRLITYLHSGSRVRGLKRDPASYMLNPYGLTYESVNKKVGSQASQFFSKIRNQLTFNKFDIKIDDRLLLQCFTHKSFAHGKVPYNEKLFIIGSHFLKVQASLHSIKSTDSQNSSGLVNGMNFDTLGSYESKNLLAEPKLFKFMESLGLHELVFWKKRDASGTKIFNGEPKIVSSVLNSVVGAILLTNGVEKASLFVNNFLLREHTE
ncbi:mitochondrial 54S ribosomal protein mL57 MRPL15 PWA37_000574 [Arxiozyma heterogenica]|uniref:RNase III domain-containing protein n=1 Tax=Arxiozyma heterogenica TaxID=278026 RepID=A0AAN7WUE7_9SACH|nr:hypothetical protein RI543_000042 [Kazachstania heterogenica]